MQRFISNLSRHRGVASAAILAACFAVSMKPAAFGQGSNAPVALTAKKTSPDSGALVLPVEQSTKTFGILGQVRQPAVYAIPSSTVRLSELVKIAGGPTERATGNAHLVRSGRGYQQTVVLPGYDTELFPGDVVVFDAIVAEQPVATSALDAVTPVEYTSDHASQEADGDVQLAFVGLYDRPVIVRMRPQEATLTNITSKLRQPPQVADTIRVVETGQRRLAHGKRPSNDVQLVSGSVLIFDRAAVALDQLPSNIPMPVSCTSTENVEGPVINPGHSPSTAQHDSALQSPDASGPAPMDEADVPPPPLENEPHATPLAESPAAPTVIPGDVISNTDQQLLTVPETSAPAAVAPETLGPATTVEEYPQWKDGPNSGSETGLHAPHSPAGPPRNPGGAAANEQYQHNQHGADADLGLHDDGRGTSPSDGTRFGSPLMAPHVPDTESHHSTTLAPSGSILSKHGFTTGDDSSELSTEVLPPEPPEEDTPDQHSETKAGHVSPFADDESEDAGTMAPPKPKSMVRIKLPGTRGFTISTDLFIVGGLGIGAVIIALLTLMPARKLPTSDTTEQDSMVAQSLETSAPIATEAVAERPAEVAEAVPVKKPVAQPVAAKSLDEEILELLIKNALPIVEEPCELKSNLSFFGRSKARAQSRVDLRHDAGTLHVAPHTVSVEAAQPAAAAPEKLGPPRPQSEQVALKQRERSRPAMAPHADLLDRALSSIQGAGTP